MKYLSLSWFYSQTKPQNFVLTRWDGVGWIWHDRLAEALHVPREHTHVVARALRQVRDLVVGQLQVFEDLFAGEAREVFVAAPLYLVARDDGPVVMEGFVEADEERRTVRNAQGDFTRWLRLSCNMEGQEF